MKKPPLLFSFCLALIMLLFGPLFFPGFRLAVFAPFLALSYNRLSFPKALWLSFLCGVLVDLFSAQVRLGIYGLNFTLTCLTIYPQRRHFFDDKASSLSFFTAFIASVSTVIQFLLLHVFERGFVMSWKTLLSDVLVMPLLDSLYAFLWFTYPLQLYTYIEKTGWKNLFKSPSQEEE